MAKGKGAKQSAEKATGDKPVKAAAAKPSKPIKAGKPNIFSRLGRYLSDVRSEMRRVVWPTRPEVVSASGVVLMTLAIFIILILVFDQISFQIVKLIGLIGS